MKTVQNKKLILVGIVVLMLQSDNRIWAQEKVSGDAKVYAIGALREVMHGNLEVTAAISKKDDIAYLFGLGPNDSLRGEITIMDGEIYLSKVGADGHPEVNTVDGIRAPFFVLSAVEHWSGSTLLETIQHPKGLESYLVMAYHMQREPFAFIIEGTIASLTYHIQDLPLEIPEGADLHGFKKTYELEDTEVKILGFYSPGHQGVFTHKDSKIHLHFVSKDKKYSGHVDDFFIGDNEMKLYLPKKN